jgi:hypothetical protein
MNDEPWIDCKKELPPDGEIVETKISDVEGLRCERTLMRRGPFWLSPDESVRAYNEPTHWRKLPEPTTPKLYACRHIGSLGEHYQRHLAAITAERLHRWGNGSAARQIGIDARRRRRSVHVSFMANLQRTRHFIGVNVWERRG